MSMGIQDWIREIRILFNNQLVKIFGAIAKNKFCAINKERYMSHYLLKIVILFYLLFH